MGESETPKGEAGKGLAYITLVYAIWGVLPAYWKLMREIDPLVILAQRAIWSFVLLAVAVAASRRPRRLLEPLRNRRSLLLLLLASSSLAIQWAAYLLAIVTDHLVDLSMGYYIYPIVVVFLGAVFLKERTSLPQKLALGLASLGVLAMVVQHRSVPVLALVLAFSFSAYSLAKKLIKVEPVHSIFYEMLFMLPFALGYVGFVEASGAGYFAKPAPGPALLLMGGGVATAATLLLFAAGARRIPIFAIGFLQYISPTMVLLLGVFAYGEEFGPGQWAAFGLIWIALLISAIPAVRAAARNKQR